MKTPLSFLAALLLVLPVLAEEASPQSASTEKKTAVKLVLTPVEAEPAAAHHGYAKVAGGKITVEQSAPDTFTVTMVGVAAAAADPCHDSQAGYTFDLTQCFDVVIVSPEVRAVKLTVEGKVIGLLRGGCHSGKGAASAEISTPAGVTICREAQELASFCIPVVGVGCGDHLRVEDKAKPITLTVQPGTYTLHQVFGISAEMGKCLALWKGPSAEFAAPPALAPVWIGGHDPLKDADKKDLGFQVTVKVAPE